MAMDKEKAPEVKAAPKPMQKAEAPKPVSSEAKVKFLFWFTGALSRFKGIKAHHMTSIRAYFKNLNLGEPETVEAYDKGLLKFGFRKKK